MRKLRAKLPVLVALIAVGLALAAYSSCFLQMAERATPPMVGLPPGAVYPAPPPPELTAAPPQADPTTRRPLFWNSWLSETAQTNGAPLSSLVQDADYSLTLDLAGIDYSQFNAKVQATVPSGSVVEKLYGDGDTSRFEVLVLADPEYFEQVGTSPWQDDLQVHVADVLRYSGGVAGPPFGADAVTAPAYRFGQVRFRVRTKRLSRFPVRTQLGVSIWSGERPIDAIELPVCIQRGGVAQGGESCDATRGPVARASTAWPDDKSPADASLQLVGQGDERIWSVFRRKGEPLRSATQWTVSKTGEAAVRTGVESVLNAMEKAKLERLPSLGRAMLSVLFGDASSAEARKVVEGTLRSMIDAGPARGSSAGTPAVGHGRPTLLIKTPRATLIPLGLATIPMGRDKDDAFLGRQFAIEVPLERGLDASPHRDGCDLSWISVLPPDLDVRQGADETMVEVRKRLGRRSSPLLRRWDTASPSSCSFSRIDAFGGWMDEGESGATRAGLLLLSHHAATPGKNLLFFATDQSDGIPPQLMRRRFGKGSLAILNACGTGGASALGFVERLNGLGFQSIVATATEVRAPLAGDFTYCLAQQITERPAPVGPVFDATVDCLSELDDQVHGARAYTYTLLGDRSTTICAQPKDQPCSSYQ